MFATLFKFSLNNMCSWLLMALSESTGGQFHLRPIPISRTAHTYSDVTLCGDALVCVARNRDVMSFTTHDAHIHSCSAADPKGVLRVVLGCGLTARFMMELTKVQFGSLLCWFVMRCIP